MTRRFLLAAWLGCLLTSTALAQNVIPGEGPRPLPVEISPESFPTVTPLPPKPPVVSTPEPSLEPSQEPSPQPSFTPSPTPQPTVRPTSRPSPTPQPSRTPSPQGKAQLSFSFPKLTEGQRFRLKLQITGNGVSYPVKGWIRYQDATYDYSKTVKEAIPFELNSDSGEVSLLFRSPGSKQIHIETASGSLPTRNARVFVQPFAATIFPVSRGDDFERDPDLWQVWVNLHHSLSAAHPQRQYYMVTYRGEVVQKLLTSSATPGKLTPEGRFRLGVKIASPKSTLYDSVMPFWTTILIPGHSAEYGNHGLTGESYLYHLGVPASHGCLRLSNKWIQQSGQWLNIGGAKWVYSHVPVGTPIQIFRKPVQPFAFQNYSMWLARKR